MDKSLIYIAKITKPHGIRGQAKVISYASPPENIFNYPCLYDENLKEYKIKNNGQKDNVFVISFNHNTSRNHTEEIIGTELYITKEMLSPTKEDEYYNRDLEGLSIIDQDNKIHGHIIEIHNFGAGDIIEMQILDKKDTIFLPFNKEFISEVNLDKKHLVFDFLGSGIDYKQK
ncbi:MAG: ribosome maturation factor RimM [Rickettsiales bacterium]|jgi:16S rRNA processing protein RimM|nr:ribosome maturation factor RimM [Rickettsiales bacterium]